MFYDLMLVKGLVSVDAPDDIKGFECEAEAAFVVGSLELLSF